MLKQSLAIALLAAFALTVGDASAAEFGTTEEARAMLDRAIMEVKADKYRAVEKFNHNDWPFRDRDLFVFCFSGTDGKFTAHEAFVGWDALELRDRIGQPFWAKMYKIAQEEKITEISYVSPIPGSTEPVFKRAYVTRLDDQVCGVSAYQPNTSGEPTH